MFDMFSFGKRDVLGNAHYICYVIRNSSTKSIKPTAGDTKAELNESLSASRSVSTKKRLHTIQYGIQS